MKTIWWRVGCLSALKQQQQRWYSVRLLWESVLLLASCALLLVLLVLVIASESKLRELLRQIQQQQPSPDKKFIVDTPGCRILHLDPLEPENAAYFQDPEQFTPCEEDGYSAYTHWQRGPPLSRSDLNALWLLPERLQLYNISRPEKLVCCLQALERDSQGPDNYDSFADGRSRLRGPCVRFSSPLRHEILWNDTALELVRVECHVRIPTPEPGRSTTSATRRSSLRWRLSDSLLARRQRQQMASVSDRREVYRDFHAFVPRKPSVEERCNSIPKRDEEMSVLILGIDSVSRLEMLRELPLLHQTLLQSPFEAVPLLGYNKVGDNTFPNVMALLTGLAEHELARSCPWPSPEAKLDPCPFLWSEFARRGYRTAYGEDAMGMAAFNSHKTGFVEQPTDYYLRPYMDAVEHDIGHQEHLGAHLCTGGDLAISRVLDYVNKFATRFSGERSFGFFWTTSLTHDQLSLARHADPLYSGLLRQLVKSGALNRTVLLLVSDHGLRYGAFRETPQGGLEERLPLAYLAFPDWFRRRFPEAVTSVRQNAHRLTTPFDLHATLRDLLTPIESLSTQALDSRAKCLKHPTNRNCASWSMPREISLFLPIPSHRTCEDAGIPLHFCSCHEDTEQELSPTSPVAQQAAHFVLSHLNTLLLPAAEDCAVLRLANVTSALAVSEKSLLRVTLRTEPGDALFEATLTHLEQVFHLEGPVSRLNAFGRQSSCVQEAKLKLYCYCENYIKEFGTFAEGD